MVDETMNVGTEILEGTNEEIVEAIKVDEGVSVGEALALTIVGGVLIFGISKGITWICKKIKNKKDAKNHEDGYFDSDEEDDVPNLEPGGYPED